MFLKFLPKFADQKVIFKLFYFHQLKNYITELANISECFINKFEYVLKYP